MHLAVGGERVAQVNAVGAAAAVDDHHHIDAQVTLLVERVAAQLWVDLKRCGKAVRRSAVSVGNSGVCVKRLN
jgi:hypothetical protein